MRSRLAVFLFFGIFFTSVVCFAQNVGVLERFLNTDSNQKYLLCLPQYYTSEKKYPLFIAIHWFQGTAKQQINEWKFLTSKNGYVLLAPQFSEGYQQCRGNERQKLLKIISEVENEFSIDKGKIFLVGYSGGAQFVHRFAYRYPFVKAACVLAAGDYDPPPKLDSAKTVKYFIVVGEEDERYKKMQEFYKLLKRKGYDATFKSFPLVGHTLHSSIKNAVIEFLNTVQ